LIREEKGRELRNLGGTEGESLMRRSCSRKVNTKISRQRKFLGRRVRKGINRGNRRPAQVLRGVKAIREGEGDHYFGLQKKERSHRFKGGTRRLI